MLIPIGQFSKMVRLSVKALRLYADRGLLLPAYTDSETSYRYYKASQAKRAEIIRILRSVDMPLNEILEVLDVTNCWTPTTLSKLSYYFLGHNLWVSTKHART